MARKPHPADIDNAAIVASAVEFRISLFLGAGRYAAETAGTLDEARAKAARLAEAHNNVRAPLIYGIDANGRAGLVTPQMQATRKEPEMSKQSAHDLDDIPAFLERKAKPAKAEAAKPAAKPEAAPKRGIRTELSPIFDMLDANKDAGGDAAWAAALAKPKAARAAKPEPAAKPAKVETKPEPAKPANPETATRKEPEMSKPAKIPKAKPAKAAKKAAPKAAKAKAAKSAKAAPAKPASNGKAKAEPKAKPLGKRAAILAAAEAGKLPKAPDFSADTHTRFRPALAEVVEMAKAGDLAKLRRWKYPGFMSSSPKAIQRYRDLCIIALAAQGK